MLDAPAAKGIFVARMACLLAVAPPLGIALLVLSSQSPNLWFGALIAALVAIILRAAVLLPRGDEAVFAHLWLALGVTMGIVVLGAFSVGPAFLITVMMLAVAIATAPNWTGRSRARWSYVAVQVLAFVATVARPLVIG